MNSEKVQKVALVNNDKFNKLINALTKNNEDNKVLSNAEDNVEKMKVLEGHQKMKEAVKRNSSDVGESKIQFLKKKRLYKESLAEKENKQEEEEDKDPAPDGGEIPKTGTKERARHDILKYFKEHKIIKGRAGQARFNQAQQNFNYDDLVTDLITDNKTRPGNLNQDELNQALRELDRLGMPTNLIRSRAVRDLYKTIRSKRLAEDEKELRTPGPPSASPSTSGYTPATPRGTGRGRGRGRGQPQSWSQYYSTVRPAWRPF